jgi:hypothetical protein
LVSNVLLGPFACFPPAAEEAVGVTAKNVQKAIMQAQINFFMAVPFSG